MDTPSEPSLLVRVLGELQLELNGEPAPYPSGRPGRLLAALVLAEGRTVSPDRLVDDIWPEDVPTDPRAALHTTVARARRALGRQADVLTRNDAGYRLAGRSVDTDARRFLDLARSIRELPPVAAVLRYDEALSLWRGPAWGDYAIDLARGAAAALEEARLDVLEHRAAALLEAGRLGEAVVALRVLVAEHPGRERRVRLLMTALDQLGDVGAALDVFEEHRVNLVETLGLDPSPALMELHRSVLQRQLQSSRLEPPRQAPARTASRARAPLAPALHGRDAHVAALEQQLALHRTVTVVGPGGVGKTSLAAAVVRTRAHWWVDLAGVADPAHVRTTVAELVGVELFPGADLDQALRGRVSRLDGVLVLDNCEHVLKAAADVALEVLSAGSEVRVLATSRERLGVPDEQVLPLPPLQLPPPQSAGRDSPAVTLFLERAQAVAPDLQPTEDVLRTVADVVRRLDGLPLAIELAAGRVGSVTLHDLRERLGARLDLLRGGSARSQGRQRTLVSTIEWSYELLDAEERAAFLRLSVFAAGFDLDAADCVLGPNIAGDVADLVVRLADQSLLVRPGLTGRGEYRMLETLRAFALDRLHPDELSQVRLVHAAYVADLAEQAATGMRGTDEQVWADLLDRREPDLASALTWTLAEGHADLAARIMGALHRWAYSRLRADILAHALDVLQLELPRPVPEVHVAASSYFWMVGDHEQALVEGRRALDSAVDPTCRTDALDALSDVALAVGDLDAAAGWSRAGLDLALESASWAQATIAALALVLATTYSGADADELLETAHELAARSGSPSRIAFVKYAEGEVWGERDPTRALAALAEAREIAGRVGNRIVTGVSMTVETALLARAGPLTTGTVETCCAAVEHWMSSGSEALFLTCLRNLLPLLDRLGAHRELLELVGATNTEIAYGAEADRLDAMLARAADALGEESYQAAMRTGSARTTRAAAELLVQQLRALVEPQPV